LRLEEVLFFELDTASQTFRSNERFGGLASYWKILDDELLDVRVPKSERWNQWK